LVRFWLMKMDWAAVPKTPVNEYSDFLFGKCYINMTF
jgi:hypothetical protein